MSRDLNRYEQILEVAKIADKLDFEERGKVKQEKDYIKRIINKPKKTIKVPHEAYLEYFNKKNNRS